jgi:hypothetical protein
LEPGNLFTWRFKTKDYWEAMRVPRQIQTVAELMALHEPWVTSSASDVLQVIESHGGQPSLDGEGLIVVAVDDEKVEEINLELARLGCRLSNELLHTL